MRGRALYVSNLPQVILGAKIQYFFRFFRTHKELGDHMKFTHFEETKDLFCTQPNVSIYNYLFLDLIR